MEFDLYYFCIAILLGFFIIYTFKYQPKLIIKDKNKCKDCI